MMHIWCTNEHKEKKNAHNDKKKLTRRKADGQIKQYLQYHTATYSNISYSLSHIGDKATQYLIPLSWLVFSDQGLRMGPPSGL